MQKEPAENFLNYLVKYIQLICHDHIGFNQDIEVIGHLFLNIDNEKKLNCIVNEKCSRVDTSTLLISNSFSADPGSKSTAEIRQNTLNIQCVSNEDQNANESTKTPRRSLRKRKVCSDSDENNSATNNKICVTDKLVSEKEEEEIEEEEVSFNEIISNTVIKTEVVTDEDGPIVYSTSRNNLPETRVNDSTTEEVDSILCESTLPDDTEQHDDDDNNIEETMDNDANPLATKQEKTICKMENADDSIIKCIQKDTKFLVEDSNVDYTVVDMGTKKGKPLLVDNVGYSYSIRRKTNEVVHWICSKRNKNIKCNAGLTQIGSFFGQRRNKHSHEPKPGLLTSTLIMSEARAQAHNDFITPTSLVVERAMTVKGSAEEDSCLPRHSNLKRMINRYRQIKRESLAKSELIEIESELPQVT